MSHKLFNNPTRNYQSNFDKRAIPSFTNESKCSGCPIRRDGMTPDLKRMEKERGVNYSNSHRSYFRLEKPKF